MEKRQVSEKVKVNWSQSMIRSNAIDICVVLTNAYKNTAGYPLSTDGYCSMHSMKSLCIEEKMKHELHRAHTFQKSIWKASRCYTACLQWQHDYLCTLNSVFQTKLTRNGSWQNLHPTSWNCAWWWVWFFRPILNVNTSSSLFYLQRRSKLHQQTLGDVLQYHWVWFQNRKSLFIRSIKGMVNDYFKPMVKKTLLVFQTSLAMLFPTIEFCASPNLRSCISESTLCSSWKGWSPGFQSTNNYFTILLDTTNDLKNSFKTTPFYQSQYLFVEPVKYFAKCCSESRKSSFWANALQCCNEIRGVVSRIRKGHQTHLSLVVQCVCFLFDSGFW